MKKCPKCEYERKPIDDEFIPNTECPKCGVVYDKAALTQKEQLIAEKEEQLLQAERRLAEVEEKLKSGQRAKKKGEHHTNNIMEADVSATNMEISSTKKSKKVSLAISLVIFLLVLMTVVYWQRNRIDIWIEAQEALENQEIAQYSNGLDDNKAAENQRTKEVSNLSVRDIYDKGLTYMDGIGVARNDTEAVRWFRLAAEQGYAPAQSDLGFMYHNGLGVSKDDSEAVKWYQKAADQGYVRAQVNLGLMYRDGSGVVRDETEAVKWLKKAAEQGDAFAQAKLKQLTQTASLSSSGNKRVEEDNRKRADSSTSGPFDECTDKVSACFPQCESRYPDPMLKMECNKRCADEATACLKRAEHEIRRDPDKGITIPITNKGPSQTDDVPKVPNQSEPIGNQKQLITETKPKSKSPAYGSNERINKIREIVSKYDLLYENLVSSKESTDNSRYKESAARFKSDVVDPLISSGFNVPYCEKDIIRQYAIKVKSTIKNCPIYIKPDPTLDIEPANESSESKMNRLQRGLEEMKPVRDWVDREIQKQDPAFYWELEACLRYEGISMMLPSFIQENSGK